jgi:hypothetical protein
MLMIKRRKEKRKIRGRGRRGGGINYQVFPLLDLIFGADNFIL